MVEGARGIQSVEVSGRILRALARSARPMMLKDLAEDADLKPAQCHAYLTSLKNVGFVRQDWATGLYSAGPFALRLGVSWLNGNPQTAAAKLELKVLAEDFGVMALIVVWSSFGPSIAHTYAGWTQASLNLRQGSIFSVTGSANGRLFAAFGGAPEIAPMIEAELSRKAQKAGIGEDVETEDFPERIGEIRAQGYSVAEGRPIPGVNAVSVPIFAPTGELAFVASLIGSAANLPVGRDAPAVLRMLQLGRTLSATAADPGTRQKESAE